MTVPGSSASARSFIVERLMGETGEPHRVTESARALATRAIPALLEQINGRLSYPIEMEVEAVETARFSEARPAEGSYDALAIASSSTSPDALAMILDADAVAMMICALFGGDPDIPAAPIERQLSPIEAALAGDVFEIVARTFNGSGARSMDIRFPLAPVYSGPDMKRLVLRDGPAARVVYRLISPAGVGRLTVLMPQRVLLAHRGDGGQAEATGPEAWRARFGEEVMRSTVSLEAAIPLSKMTLADLSELRVGDLIEFPEDAQARTRLSARRKTLFVCEFGKLGNHYTVRIRAPFDAGQDFIDGLVTG
jgi:flagellar motor switch protein FliM